MSAGGSRNVFNQHRHGRKLFKSGEQWEVLRRKEGVVEGVEKQLTRQVTEIRESESNQTGAGPGLRRLGIFARTS
jgi:hypothetical protein